jgi:hypothetical protein
LPTTDPSVTSVSKIKATWGQLLTDLETGYSEVLSYSLEIDDGTGGDFTPVVGVLTNYLRTEFTITSGIEQGTLYRLRVRARNAIGWGPYSQIAYIRAANKPAQPPQLQYVSSTSTTVTLSIPRSQDNGGSPITGYKLW